MAKKNNPIKQPGEMDLDLDFDDLGLGDPFADEGEIKRMGKGNKPIRAVAGSFASGALRGFGREDNVRRLASNALPAGYGTAVNTGYEAVALGASLYNTAAKELRPAMPTIRRTVGAVANKTQRFLPKKFKDKLDAFSEHKDAQQQQSDYDEDAIQGALGEVFGVQMEEQARQREEDKAESRLRSQIQDKQMMTSNRIMDAIRQNTERLAAYQDSVLARFQRKSLEIGYRQLFIQRDMLRLMTVTEQRQHLQMTALVKNTALPEYRKTSLHEANMASFRDKLVGNYQQKAVDYVANFTRNLGKNLNQAVGGAVSSIASGIETADGARDMLNSAGEMGMSRSGLLAEQAGGMIVPLLTRLISRPILKATNRHEPTRKLGSKLNYWFSNAAERTNEFAQSSSDSTTIQGGFMRMLKELLPRVAMDPTLGQGPLHDADQGAAFNKQTQRSIVEIIPGYLSRIHHELVMTRTNDPKAARTVYNMNRGEFTTFGTASADARKTILHPHRMNHGREQVDNWVDSLDEQKQLSPEARAELRRQVAMDSVGGKYFRPERYMDAESDTSEMSAKTREEIKRLFGSKFRSEDGEINYDNLNKYDSTFRSLKGAIHDPKAALSVYRDAGLRELLDGMNLIDRQGDTDRVNYAKFYDELLSARAEDQSPDLDPNNPGGGPSGPGGPGGSGGSRPHWDAGVWGKAGRRARRSAKVKAGRLVQRATAVAGGARNALNGARGTVNQVVTLYNTEGREAVVDLAKLTAGEYYDTATDQVVTKLSDLRGDLTDRSDRVILKATDVASGYLADHPEVQRQLDRAKVTARKVQREAAKRARGPSVKARRRAKLMGRTARDTLMDAGATARDQIDVYLDGGMQPKLEAAALAAGEYYDQASGQVIHSYQEIKGTVVDATGKVVLAAKDWARGLKDQSGRSLNWLQMRLREGAEQARTLASRVQIPSRTTEPQAGRESEAAGEADESLVSLGNRQVQLLSGILDVLENGDFMSPAGAEGERRTRGAAGRMRSMLGGVGSRLGKFARGYGRFAMGVWKSPFQAVGGAFKALRGGAGLLGEYMGDIRTRNGRVAMTYLKMKNGDYWDRLTNRQVRKYRDITGPVEDRSTTPVLEVLSAQEYQEGLFDTQGRKVVRAVGDVFGRLAKFAGTVGGGYLSMLSMPFKAASWVSRKLSQANAPQDVYVQGDPTAPRVTVTEMQSGKVFQADRHTRVRQWSDIRGQTFKIVDGTLRQCISLEEFKAGLCDYQGKRLRRGSGLLNGLTAGAGGLLGGAGRLAGGYMKLVGGLYGAMGRGLMGLGKGVGRLFGMGGRRGEMSADEATITLLSQIRDLIMTRLPALKKVRKGSWEERMQASLSGKSAKDEEKKAEEKEKNSFLGKLFSKFGSKLAGWFGGDDADEDSEDGDDGDTTIISGGGGDGRGNSRDARGRRRGGFRRRMEARRRNLGRRLGRSRLGRLAGAGWGRAAGLARRIPGRGLLGRLKPRGFGLGGLAATAGMALGGDALVNKLGGEKTTAGRVASGTLNTAGTAMTAYSLYGMGSSLLGGGAAAGGAGAAAGGVAGAGATVGGAGVLATVGLPVAIGAAVIGAAAYVGYKGWKKYKYGSYEPMRSFRMAQYGINYTETDHAKMICDLEQMVEPFVRPGPGGLDIFADKDFSIDAVYKLFDLDDGWFSDNKQERAKFDVWFNHRFKPVFLLWKTNLQSIDKRVALNDAEELTPAQKTQLLKAVNTLNPSVYSVMQGPFEGDMLEMKPDAIADQYKLALNGIDKSKTFMGRAKQKLERANSGLSAMSFGLFGGDWLTNWTEKQRQARELKEINGKAAEGAAKTAAAIAKATGENRVTANTNPKPSAAAKPATGNGGFAIAGLGFGQALAAKASATGAQAGMAAGNAFAPPVDAPEPKKPTGSAKEWSQILMQEAVKAGITDKNELAMFLAQCAHESGHFSTLIEGSNYKASRAAQVFPKYFKSAAEAQAVIDAQGKAGILNRAYGNRMGNTAPGDGFKYRGRGFIQLTGKDNYARMAKATGLDVVNNPDLIATDPRVAARSAIFWWMSRGAGLREKAAALDLRGVTQLVNGGQNGFADRAQQLRLYTSELQGNTEMNNLRANTRTDKAALAQVPTPEFKFVSSGLSAVSGNSDGGAAGAASTEREQPTFVQRKAPTLNTMTMEMPPTAAGASTDRQEAMFQKQLAAQTQQATAQDARSRVATTTDNTQLKEVQSVLNAQLTVQKSMDAKLGDVVTLLSNIKVSDLSGAGVSAAASSAANTGTAARARAQGSSSVTTSEQAAIVNMRRNRRAGT